MPYISRQVGKVSSLVTLFLNDRTVSTGAGLANIVASTVRISWLRSDQAAVSSWTLTTGTLGTWGASTMTQVGSTSTLGAYQFSLPDGAFVSGDSVYIQFMSSTAAFAEVPLVIELTKTDNQTYLSSQVIGRVNAPVGVSTLPAVSSISTPVTASSVTAGVNVTTMAAGLLSTQAVSSVINEGGLIHRGTAVSSTASTISLDATLSTYANDLLTGAIVFIKGGTGAGQSRVLDDWTSTSSVAAISPNWTVNPTSTSVYEVHAAAPGSNSTFPLVTLASTQILVGASTVTTPVTASSVTAGVNVTSFVGSAAVTSAAGVLGPVRVSSISIPVSVSSGVVAVSTITVAAMSSFFTLDAGDYSTSVLGSVVQEIADNVSATVGAQVGVSSISIPVSVSSLVTSNPVTVSNITVNALTRLFDTGVVFFSTAVVSSVVFEVATNVKPPAPVGVSTLPAISSITTPVTASSVTRAVDVSSFHGTLAVTSAAGVLGPVRVSSISIPVSVSSGVVAVSTITVAAMSSFFTLDAGDYSTSVLGSVVQEIADNVSATVGAQVGVSSISIPVSVSAVTVPVSTATPVTVSNMTVGALTRFFDTGAVFFSTAVVSSVAFEIATNVKPPAGVGVSSIATPVTASSVSAPVGVSTLPAVSSITTPVSASSVTVPVGVSTLTVAAVSSLFTLDAGDYSTSVLGSVVKEIADNVSATVGAQVGVSSISIPVSVSSVSVVVSSNIVKVNNVTVTGTGAAGDEWGP
jgi:hypothetical protein